MYCISDHSIARVLTSRSEVQNFLDKFKGTLNVVSMDENSAAKPGGLLFQRFKKKMDALPKDKKRTCLAFHGTPENNISSICNNGYDKSLRSGQAHGPGEYFAVSPATPLAYCKGGKKLLLNELLLGVQGTHHTQSGDIVVMKDPHHDLPRFVITFK